MLSFVDGGKLRWRHVPQHGRDMQYLSAFTVCLGRFAPTSFGLLVDKSIGDDRNKKSESRIKNVTKRTTSPCVMA